MDNRVSLHICKKKKKKKKINKRGRGKGERGRGGEGEEEMDILQALPNIRVCCGGGIESNWISPRTAIFMCISGRNR